MVVSTLHLVTPFCTEYMMAQFHNFGLCCSFHPVFMGVWIFIHNYLPLPLINSVVIESSSGALLFFNFCRYRSHKIVEAGCW